MPKRKSTSHSDDWDAPSAFSKLVKGLKRSSAAKRTSTTNGTADDVSAAAVGVKNGKKGGARDGGGDSKPRKKARKGGDVEVEEDRTAEQVEVEEEESDQEDGDDLQSAADEQGESEEESEEEEEDEDEVAAAAEEEADSDSDDATGQSATDLWERHFGDHVSESLAFASASADANEWVTSVTTDDLLGTVAHATLKSSTTSDTSPATSPLPPSLPPRPASLVAAQIKQRLHEPWTKFVASKNFANTTTMPGAPTPPPPPPFTPLQAGMLSHMGSYKDILYTQQTRSNTAELRATYALHALNHVYKTRDRVLKNTAKLRADTVSPDLECRDQAFTRPKVLILAPFKNAALDIVSTLMALSGTKQQDNKKRFFDEFGSDDTEPTHHDSKKPLDHKWLFDGNIDDCFRVGLKFSRTQLKLYADFYSSDIIVASPLGLRMVIGAPGEKKRDFDFLAGIEVVVADMADTYLMQNWDHMTHLFSHLNLIPKDAHGCDFSRVRAYYLDGKAAYVRQTIILTRFLAPEINALFNRDCKNVVGGKLKLRASAIKGTIADVAVQAPQIFHRVPTQSPATADDDRFAFFVDTILPTLRDSVVQQKHSLVFVPSYFDFVRIRNYLEEHHYDAVELCEYTPTRDISRARSDFFHGRASYALTTERFHFFRRYRLRGIQHLVFYGLPEYGEYYAEMVNMLESGDRKSISSGGPTTGTTGAVVTCAALYTRYDRLKLERVVGTQRVARMCEGDKEAFMFT
ncbi:digestive organ expansion factor-like protein [Powellomyces hirtus]|nr:digestive organ expansion factor-like protein [Powellomyces hirtus]